MGAFSDTISSIFGHQDWSFFKKMKKFHFSMALIQVITEEWKNKC